VPQSVLIPPSMISLLPTANGASSEAKNSIAWAISSGWPQRSPSGPDPGVGIRSWPWLARRRRRPEPALEPEAELGRAKA
jgi:hypothetical protein